MGKKRIYDSSSPIPYRLSRTQIEEFYQCPKCFYLLRKMGAPRLPSYAFSLNSAVDSLLKSEFDEYRRKGKPHPLMVKHGIEAIPYTHKNLDTWRKNFKGIEWLNETENVIICGAVDDIWILNNGELIVVDYKATVKKEPVGIDAEWQMSYKRQIEIYQWILRKMNFKVSETGYFVYCNGNADKGSFDNILEFDVSLIPYAGNSDWVSSVVEKSINTLKSESIPESGDNCLTCSHRDFVFLNIKKRQMRS